MNRLTQAIPNKITSKIGRQVLASQKHSPTILFVGGVVGVVATTVMASRATLRSVHVIDQVKENLLMIEKAEAIEAEKGMGEYTDEDHKKDLTIVYAKATVSLAKLYGPTILVGVISIAALTKSHHILSQRNAGLAAAYAVLDKAFTEYRGRVIADVGEEEDRKYRYGTAERVEKDEKGLEVRKIGPHAASGYARFFDELCSSWQKTPELNLYFLRCQQNYANDKLQARGHMFLNEVYDMLGIERSSAGSVVGWVISKDGDNYIDFGIYDHLNQSSRNFVNGRDGAILLDFNVDGVIYDRI